MIYPPPGRSTPTRAGDEVAESPPGRDRELLIWLVAFALLGAGLLHAAGMSWATVEQTVFSGDITPGAETTLEPGSSTDDQSQGAGSGGTATDEGASGGFPTTFPTPPGSFPSGNGVATPPGYPPARDFGDEGNATPAIGLTPLTSITPTSRPTEAPATQVFELPATDEFPTPTPTRDVPGLPTPYPP